MIKNILILLILLSSSLWCLAQTKAFPKAAFAGEWVHEQSHHDLVLIIKFEKGKKYATVIDVGTGEAPSIRFKAQMQGDKLIINPQTHLNDLYIQISVEKSKLILKTQIAIWDEKGIATPPRKNGYMTKTYEKVKS